MKSVSLLSSPLFSVDRRKTNAQREKRNESSTNRRIIEIKSIRLVDWTSTTIFFSIIELTENLTSVKDFSFLFEQIVQLRLKHPYRFYLSTLFFSSVVLLTHRFHFSYWLFAYLIVTNFSLGQMWGHRKPFLWPRKRFHSNGRAIKGFHLFVALKSDLAHERFIFTED